MRGVRRFFKETYFLYDDWENRRDNEADDVKLHFFDLEEVQFNRSLTSKHRD